VDTTQHDTPLVLEAQASRSVAVLCELLEQNSVGVVSDVARVGAVLIRGFNIVSESEFERAVLSIDGIRGIKHVLMSEDGRTVVPGSHCVLYTNAKYRTGGTAGLGRFHSENYYCPDVPRYVALWCKQAPWLGGETGLVNLAGVYGDLPTPLQRALAQRPYLAAVWDLRDICDRYGVTADDMRAVCAGAGLQVLRHGDTERVLMYKPSVLIHPFTREPALAINFSLGLESSGLEHALISAFGPDYGRWYWALHRLTWRHPKGARVVRTALAMVRERGLLLHLVSAWLQRRLSQQQGRQRSPGPGPGHDDSMYRRVSDAFRSVDIPILAAAMRRRFSSFLWQVGDVLLIDNLKMAHAGMAGAGPRCLRAMICNPVELPFRPSGSGLCDVVGDGPEETLGARVVSLGRKQ